VYRALAFDHSANVFIVSSAWPFPRVEHLRTLALARAIENQSYLVLSNRVGTDDRLMTCGNSAIIDPYGVTIAAASADREEILCAEVSEDVVRYVRERMPVFADRRPELYAPSR
jgi:predicted amidohydrolase